MNNCLKWRVSFSVELVCVFVLAAHSVWQLSPTESGVSPVGTEPPTSWAGSLMDASGYRQHTMNLHGHIFIQRSFNSPCFLLLFRFFFFPSVPPFATLLNGTYSSHTSLSTCSQWIPLYPQVQFYSSEESLITPLGYKANCVFHYCMHMNSMHAMEKWQEVGQRVRARPGSRCVHISSTYT